LWTPIEDGVRPGWDLPRVRTTIDRKLAGDDQRAGVVAFLDDLQQVALLLGAAVRVPNVEDEEIDAAELAYQLA